MAIFRLEEITVKVERKIIYIRAQTEELARAHFAYENGPEMVGNFNPDSYYEEGPFEEPSSIVMLDCNELSGHSYKEAELILKDVAAANMDHS